MGTQPEYDPGRFSDLANTLLARQLWNFLNAPENVAKMIGVSDVGKPAVAGLGSRDELVRALGEEITGDRWKQLIGHMVRQVMERHPFELAGQGFKVGGESLFVKGSKYRRRLPHWGHLNVSGDRPDKHLYGGFGADSIDHALIIIEAFVEDCIRDEIVEAKVKIRERGSPPNANGSKVKSVEIVRKRGLSQTQKGDIRSALGSGALAARIDLVFKFV